MRTSAQNLAKLAFRFAIVIGIVSFFADMTYEGTRSIVGPFLGSLGASAVIVGFVSGFGEMVGYGLRSLSGYLADKTGRYWGAAFLGYVINMLAVPALALAGNWPMAAALIIAERTGRAIRRPAVESMLSRAGQSIGHGWVFGLHEALDQAGATLGPLIRSLCLVSARWIPSCLHLSADLRGTLSGSPRHCVRPFSESTGIGRYAHATRRA